MTGSVATLKPTLHGKRLIRQSMYSKGAAFIGAALLVRRNGGYEFVVLHLLCQGVEIILKSLLLLLDYDAFHPKLHGLGHDLIRIADVLVARSGARSMRPNLRRELTQLSGLYSTHRLRYGSGYDLLVDPSTIPSELVLHRVAALVRFIEHRQVFSQSAA